MCGKVNRCNLSENNVVTLRYYYSSEMVKGHYFSVTRFSFEISSRTVVLYLLYNRCIMHRRATAVLLPHESHKFTCRCVSPVPRTWYRTLHVQ